MTRGRGFGRPTITLKCVVAISVTPHGRASCDVCLELPDVPSINMFLVGRPAILLFCWRDLGLVLKIPFLCKVGRSLPAGFLAQPCCTLFLCRVLPDARDSCFCLFSKSGVGGGEDPCWRTRTLYAVCRAAEIRQALLAFLFVLLLAASARLLFVTQRSTDFESGT